MPAWWSTPSMKSPSAVKPVSFGGLSLSKRCHVKLDDATTGYNGAIYHPQASRSGTATSSKPAIGRKSLTTFSL